MIEIKNVIKKYDDQEVLNKVNWKFPSTGLICLLGASGCGKSTLFNLLAGFDSKYSGEIIVNGTLIKDMNEDELCSYRRDNIGFVFQNYHLLSGYSVLENVVLSCEVSERDVSKNLEEANAMLKRLGMKDKVQDDVDCLSGGQKQRVAIARALMGNPSIILADEPTGALDRMNSTEIMEVLKKISKDHLVLVITHDKNICEYADQIVYIEDGKICGTECEPKESGNLELKKNRTIRVSAIHRGMKNFKVHHARYMTIALAISIGVLAFMLSLSSGNLMKKSIYDFKEKNIAFNNGYIKATEKTDEIYSLLKKDKRVDNVYKQYVIQDVMLKIDENVEVMEAKYPMAKATESMSYGSMPKDGKNQIALSPSLAKKFHQDIQKLIGKKVILIHKEQEYSLTVSGLYNANHDDFFVSSDVEKEFYKTVKDEKVDSISYDVERFEDVVPVSKMLENKGIKSETASKEVEVLQSTFENLNRLFWVVSMLVLAIGLFIGAVLLVKLQNSRKKEIGLLSALGYQKYFIRSLILVEALLLSVFAATLNAMLVGILYLISSIFRLGVMITIPEILLSTLSTGIVVMIINTLASHRLIESEPAVTLRD